MKPRTRMVGLCGAVWLVLWGCHRSAPPSFSDAGVVSEGANAPGAEPAAVAVAAEPIRIPEVADDAERWLVVEKGRPGAPGAWATGSFDPRRNKLTIRTRDVQQFTVDTSRIGINWQRLVILSLNGRNSELRKRDYAVLRFRRDRHGQWGVVEP